MRKKANGKSTCLYFYAMATDFNKHPPKTMTGERVWGVSYIFSNATFVIRESRVMYNLNWLLPMGLCYLQNPEHRYLEG